MRFVVLIGMLAALSGCTSYREVTFLYYPNAPHRDTFPSRSEFYAVADKECAKIRNEGVLLLEQLLPRF